MIWGTHTRKPSDWNIKLWKWPIFCLTLDVAMSCNRVFFGGVYSWHSRIDSACHPLVASEASACEKRAQWSAGTWGIVVVAVFVCFIARCTPHVPWSNATSPTKQETGLDRSPGHWRLGFVDLRWTTEDADRMESQMERVIHHSIPFTDGI